MCVLAIVGGRDLEMRRDEEFYEGDREIVLSTAGRGETMQEVLARRWSRRRVLGSGLATGLVLTWSLPASAQEADSSLNGSPDAVAGFEPITLDEEAMT